MRVAKVVLEALTASFRYPHFIWGTHPTYDLPPPATLYGLLCAAAGRWLEPAGIRVGLAFTAAGKGTDVEHIHAIEPGGGQRQGAGGTWPVNVAGTVNPLQREFFLFPTLTLYLYPAHLGEHFRRPRLPLALGRSQDLAAVTEVRLLDLQPAASAYYAHTLLPRGWRRGRGVAMAMPRFIDPETRHAYFEWYVVTRQADVRTAGEHWVDPGEERYQEHGRGVCLHELMPAGG